MRYLLPTKPEKVFVLLASVYTLVFIMLTPPFQSPDEQKHFYRAYQVSTGDWFVEKSDDRLGGEVPASILCVADSFHYLQWQPQQKTSFKMIGRLAQKPLCRDELAFKDNPYFSMYFPVLYFPQAIALYFSVKAGLSPLVLLYIARIATALVWIGMMFLIIRIIPVFKHLMLVAALLPMSVSINSSVSADVVTYVILLLFLSVVLKLKYIDKAIGRRESVFWQVGLTLLAILASLAKSAYLPFVFLVLLLPSSFYQSKVQRSVFLVFYFGLIGLTYGLWSQYISGIYMPHSSYNPLYRHGIELFSHVNMKQQMDFVIHHPSHFAQVLFYSAKKSFLGISEQYIGQLGWLDTRLPKYVIFAGWMLVVFVALNNKATAIRLTLTDRIVLASVSVVTSCLLFLSLYMIWSPVGGDEIFGAQGRYFIVVFPLLLMAVGGVRQVVSERGSLGIIVVISVFILTVSAATLYKRYFYVPAYETIVARCDAESVMDGQQHVMQSGGAVFENANRRTTDIARSGSYALKLSNMHVYGFTHRLQGVDVGDKIEASVWYKGDEGNLIISGTKSDKLYVGQGVSDSTDADGWKRLQKTIFISNAVVDGEVVIYVYYTGADSAYFDDFEVVYCRNKKRRTGD